MANYINPFTDLALREFSVPNRIKIFLLIFSMKFWLIIISESKNSIKRIPNNRELLMTEKSSLIYIVSMSMAIILP